LPRYPNTITPTRNFAFKSIYARCDFGVDGHHPSIFDDDLDSKLIICPRCLRTPLPLRAQFHVKIEPTACCDFGVDGHCPLIPDRDFDSLICKYGQGSPLPLRAQFRVEIEATCRFDFDVNGHRPSFPIRDNVPALKTK
jgi:hypothetical protein